MKISLSIKLTKIERAIIVIAGLAAIAIGIYAAGNMPNRENLFSCEPSVLQPTNIETTPKTVKTVLDTCQEQIISAVLFNYKVAFIIQLFIYWLISALGILIVLVLVKWIVEEKT
ncbi:hypothetical protein QIW46_04635 [Pseudomonas fluorescens]|uniref:hypothetical protein n=1 Tax=Pseudomonas fluorescens TaxID=294 RepID=UPI0035235E73